MLMREDPGATPPVEEPQEPKKRASLMPNGSFQWAFVALRMGARMHRKSDPWTVYKIIKADDGDVIAFRIEKPSEEPTRWQEITRVDPAALFATDWQMVERNTPMPKPPERFEPNLTFEEVIRRQLQPGGKLIGHIQLALPTTVSRDPQHMQPIHIHLNSYGPWFKLEGNQLVMDENAALGPPATPAPARRYDLMVDP